MFSMKFVSVIAALTCAAAPAFAQSSASLKIGVSGGGTLPTGGFANTAKSGFNFGAHAGLSSPFFPQDFKLQFQHNRMDSKGSKARSLVTSGTLDLEWNLSPAVAAVAPFVDIGLGGYYVKVPTLSATPGVFNYKGVTKFGCNAGGGLKIPLSGFSTFVEADYNRVVTHGKSFRSRSITYVPIYFGITL
jgi:hypothetical protein